ncbi:PREDICTED: golgin subfamily A member 8A-like, partial [Mandrillus leucophaeus]|uniref:golgin subfamily A member 8A-like n=1 Tax=Mandrillus leucophaeus TaxID=9568 RepID=UPI0005F51BD9
MWPQPRLPPHSAMAEETRQSILAEAKKKLKEYWQRNSPGGPAGAKKNRKTNGSSPETATSGGSHSPGDSATGIDGEGPMSSAPLKDLEVRGSGRRGSDPAGQPSNLLPQQGLGAPLPAETAHTHPSPNDCSLYLSPDSSSTSSSLHAPQSPSQELAAVLDSRSVKISRLNNIIKSLEQQKKQVEHQLEEEKKANNEKQKTERELEVQIQRLNRQIKELNTDMNHTKRSLRYFEEESKDLAGRLQQTLQCIEELEQALSAVPATQEEKEISFSSRSQALIEWQLEQSIQEKARLKAQLTQMKDSLKQAHVDREEYAQHLKGERAQWQQRMRKMWQEVCTLKKEKKDDTHRVEELKRSLSKLKHQMGEMGLNNKNKSALQLEQQVEELQETLDEERLEASSQQSQELNAPLNLTALPGEGDGGEHLGSEEEEAPQPMPSVPQDLESWEAMSGCMDHREEMADLSELVEKPELPFIEYWGERCHQNVHQLLTEAGGSVEDAAMGGGHHQAGPAQGGDEGRVCNISAGVG